MPEGEFSVFESYSRALRSAERLVYLENQFLWSPEIVSILVDKLRDPPSDEFRVVAVLPARPNDGADVSRGAISALIHADDGNERFLACTLYARTGPLRDLVYVHSKIGIVDDRWLTIGSANLNERSMFNDSEVNVVTLDEALARRTRLGLWEEHLETSEVDGDPAVVVDELWRPIATQQLAHLEPDGRAAHRLVMLPGVSRRARRISGASSSHASTTAEPRAPSRWREAGPPLSSGSGFGLRQAGADGLELRGDGCAEEDRNRRRTTRAGARRCRRVGRTCRRTRSSH